MKIKHLEGADFSLVEIRSKLPYCKIHGAMNKVSKEGYWRCITTYSRVRDNDCRAGCVILA